MNRVGEKQQSVSWLRLLLVVPLLLAGLLLFSPAYGAGIPQRTLTISDDHPSTSAIYLLEFTIPSSQTLGSIQLQFCSNSPLLGQSCTPPSGFDVSSATLSSQSGETGFAIYPAGTNANTIVLSRVPTLAAAGSVSYTLTGVINPSSLGEYYGRLQTFASSDASGPENDHGGLALSLNSDVQVSTTVPPYLLFCAGVTVTGFDCSTVSGNYINFGNLTSSSTATAESVMVTATNALSGFGITVAGTTMISGNNVINAIAPTDVSRPGVGQFGFNLVANTAPNVGQDPTGPGVATPTANYDSPDFYRFVSGDLIASTPTVDDFRKFTASYIINIPLGQPVGVYASTLTYICLANF